MDAFNPNPSSQVQAELILVTPQIAAKFLGKNDRNRPIKWRRVQQLADAMMRGEWKETHQGIAFSPDDVLIDGQHRLLAIVETGISQWLWVFRNVDPAAFPVVDTGAPRTAADTLAIDKAHNCTVMAACIKQILLYDAIPDKVWSGPHTRAIGSNSAIQARYQESPRLWESIIHMVKPYRFTNVNIPSVFGALCYLAIHQGYSLEICERVAKGLRDGAGLERRDPILVYRNRMLRTKQHVSQQQRLADYIRLLNAVTRGERLANFVQPLIPPVKPMPVVFPPLAS